MLFCPPEERTIERGGNLHPKDVRTKDPVQNGGGNSTESGVELTERRHGGCQVTRPREGAPEAEGVSDHRSLFGELSAAARLAKHVRRELVGKFIAEPPLEAIQRSTRSPEFRVGANPRLQRAANHVMQSWNIPNDALQDARVLPKR